MSINDDSRLDMLDVENAYNYKTYKERKQAFIEWMETYPLNKTCDFDTMIRAELLLEVIDKAKEML